MSNTERKLRKRQRIEAKLSDGSITPDDVLYAKNIKRQIRSGAIPAFHLVKGADGRYERALIKGRMRFTWRQVGTYATLIKK